MVESGHSTGSSTGGEVGPAGRNRLSES